MDNTAEYDSAYAVKVEAFEGPMELLLHLIKKNEINIYDIPMALITRQYLETLDLMRSLNLSVVGEFLVMAATLIHIKSRMLLPVPELAFEEDDPRRHLVGQLLVYQQFKEVADVLEGRDRVWRDIFRREPVSPDPSTTDEVFIGEVTLYDLLEALKDVVARLPDRSVLEISEETLSVSDRIQFILEQLEQIEAYEGLLFDMLFDRAVTRVQVIITFLALLEMIKLGLIRVLQIEAMGPIRLFRKIRPEGRSEDKIEITEGDDGGE